MVYEYEDRTNVEKIIFSSIKGKSKVDSINIYNIDHSLHKKTCIYPDILDPTQSHWFYVYFPSTHLFNNHDKVEMIIQDYYQTLLINEDGNIILEFDGLNQFDYSKAY